MLLRRRRGLLGRKTWPRAEAAFYFPADASRVLLPLPLRCRPTIVDRRRFLQGRDSLLLPIAIPYRNIDKKPYNVQLKPVKTRGYNLTAYITTRSSISIPLHMAAHGRRLPVRRRPARATYTVIAGMDLVHNYQLKFILRTASVNVMLEARGLHRPQVVLCVYAVRCAGHAADNDVHAGLERAQLL